MCTRLTECFYTQAGVEKGAAQNADRPREETPQVLSLEHPHPPTGAPPKNSIFGLFNRELTHLLNRRFPLEPANFPPPPAPPLAIAKASVAPRPAAAPPYN